MKVILEMTHLGDPLLANLVVASLLPTKVGVKNVKKAEGILDLSEEFNRRLEINPVEVKQSRRVMTASSYS